MSSHTMKITTFFTSIAFVTSAHLVVVSISMGISSMIEDMPKAENNPSRGTIWGTAMANIAADWEKTAIYFLRITFIIRVASRRSY